MRREYKKKSEKTVTKYTVSVILDRPSEYFTISGTGIFNSGQSTTITISSLRTYFFFGWYDGSGNILSTTTSYTISSITSNITLYGKIGLVTSDVMIGPSSTADSYIAADTIKVTYFCSAGSNAFGQYSAPYTSQDNFTTYFSHTNQLLYAYVPNVPTINNGGGGLISYNQPTGSPYMAMYHCPTIGTGPFTIAVRFQTPSSFNFYSREEGTYGSARNLLVNSDQYDQAATLVSNCGDGWANTLYNEKTNLYGISAANLYRYDNWTSNALTYTNYGFWAFDVYHAVMTSGSYNTLRFRMDNRPTSTSETWIQSNTVISANTNYYAVITRDSNGEIKMFLNGNQVDINIWPSGQFHNSVTVTPTNNLCNGIDYLMPMHIGTFERGGDGVAYGFKISRIYMTDFAMDQTQIQTYINDY